MIQSVKLEKVNISGRLVDPLVEGGKGVNISNGFSSGAWSSCGGVGTISATSAIFTDENGKVIRNPKYQFKGEDRYQRHLELINMSISGAIFHINVAHEIMSRSDKVGALNLNVLWECGGVPQILHGILSKVGYLVNGIVCGAGLPFDLAKIAAKYAVYYNPIVSSALAFNILWRKSYSKVKEWLGSVVYECPWRAGGHNGITQREDPKKPASTYERVLSLRKCMNNFGLHDTTLVIAGGIWNIKQWVEEENADLSRIAPVAFQFGTRPLLTKESTISEQWKQKLFDLKKGDVMLQKFSPTGFYSSAVRNSFLRELEDRSARQVPYSESESELYNVGIAKGIYVSTDDHEKINSWQSEGYESHMITPDKTLIFVTRDRKKQILFDQMSCKGCLNKCRFSNFSQHDGSTGLKPDPRSFCIANTLYDAGCGEDIDKNLMFSGTSAYKFSEDPFYKNKYIPSVKELYNRIIEECNDA